MSLDCQPRGSVHKSLSALFHPDLENWLNAWRVEKARANQSRLSLAGSSINLFFCMEAKIENCVVAFCQERGQSEASLEFSKDAGVADLALIDDGMTVMAFYCFLYSQRQTSFDASRHACLHTLTHFTNFSKCLPIHYGASTRS